MVDLIDELAGEMRSIVVPAVAEQIPWAEINADGRKRYRAAIVAILTKLCHIDPSCLGQMKEAVRADLTVQEIWKTAITGLLRAPSKRILPTPTQE